MGCELSHQIGLQLRQFLGQPSRNRLRSQLTRLPSLFQIAFEGGQRHAKQLHDLSSRAALVYRTHHSFPQIFRIRFHTSCSLSLLASRSFTYSITWLNSSASRCSETCCPVEWLATWFLSRYTDLPHISQCWLLDDYQLCGIHRGPSCATTIKKESRFSEAALLADQRLVALSALTTFRTERELL